MLFQTESSLFDSKRFFGTFRRFFLTFYKGNFESSPKSCQVVIRVANFSNSRGYQILSLQGVCNGPLVTICKNESNCHVPTFDIGTINARIRTMSHWRVQVLVAVALYAILYNVEVLLQIKTTWSKNDPSLISLKEQQQQHQRLVMYVGPIKTASTTLQYIMKEHNRTLQEDDGFNVQGRLSPGAIRLPMLASMRNKNCRYRTETARLHNTNLPECRETISNELDVSSKSILIVEENLSDLRFD